MSIFDILGGPVKGLVDGVGGILDSLTTTDEEKLAAKAKLLALQQEFASRALDYERAIAEEQGKTIRAEATGHSWLQRNWRPTLMLWFAGLVGAYWFGFTPENLSDAVVQKLFAIVQYGVTGYIVGRSAEKIVPQLSRRRDASQE